MSAVLQFRARVRRGLVSVGVLLTLAASQPAGAQDDAGDGVTEEQQAASEARAALDACQCLPCFPSAIRYADQMAEGFGEMPAHLAAVEAGWRANRLVRADFPDLSAFLGMAEAQHFELFHRRAVERSPSPPQCEQAETGSDAVMATNPWTCEIDMRESARRTMPCADLYLATVAHELNHRNFCISLPPGARYSIDRSWRAASEADAYAVEADVLRILYMRRARECEAPTVRGGRFTDLPNAVEYLYRALDYERDNPLTGPSQDGPPSP